MTKPTRDQLRQLGTLSALTALALEARLVEVRRLAAAREATRAAIAALNSPRPPPERELPLAAAARADMLYDRWADRQRRALNLTLARQTAAWMEGRSGAATAFGRNDVLARIRADLCGKLAQLKNRV